MNRRTPYVIKVRCILNGADTTALLYLKAAADAHDAMKRRVPPREREHLRVVECREATRAEIFAHSDRIAEWA